MSGRPGLFGGDVSGSCGDVPDLQPSKDDVKFRRVADEAERTSDFLGAAKISEKNKQIAWADVVAREMALRGAGLSKDWTPSRGARNRLAAQIRIEMRTVATADSSMGQVFNNLRDR